MTQAENSGSAGVTTADRSNAAIGSHSPGFATSAVECRTRCVSVYARFVAASSWWALLGWIGLITIAAGVDAAPPVLEHLSPAGGQRGTKVRVTCAGTTTWPPKIWSPGVEAVPTAESGKIEITIPPDLATDRVWLRLYNAEGASALKPFLIGGFQEMVEVEPNERPREAQALHELPVTINGALKAADVDCFAVPLKAGQMLVAAVDANTRMGSLIDAIVQIVSAQGIVLAENHDDLNLDPRLSFTAPSDGTYIVRLFAFPSAPDASINFTGGANHLYRLTLTTGPLATHTIPLTAPLAEPGTTSFAGWNMPLQANGIVIPLGASQLAEQREFDSFDDLHRDSAARVGIASSLDGALMSRVRLTPQAVVRGYESRIPNEPLTISPSSSVTGRLKERKQIDEYRVPLTKGQQVVFSVEARSLGLPLDAVLKVFDPQGKLVAEVDDTGPSRDAAITHLVGEDGIYRITVSDRVQQGGERCWYLLTVRDDEPDFELAVANDSLVVPADMPGELNVKIRRTRNPNPLVGPITIQAVGLPEGLTVPAVISEPMGPTSIEVKLAFQPTGKAFSGPFRIQGTASSPREIQRMARTPALLGASFETIWLTVIEKPAATQ